MTPSEESHLRLVATLHYVYAAVNAVFSLFPLIHVAIGLAIVSGAIPLPEGNQQSPPMPREFGYLFIVFGSMFIVFGLLVSLLILFAARNLSKRKSHTFCMIVAGIECLFIPIGTALGVFTLITLSKDSVRLAFDKAAMARIT